MSERGYQPDFFALSEPVRDPGRRKQKAEKIRWVLTNFAPFDLASATCLDVGCSSGMMTAALASLFRHTYGLDFDSLALASTQPEDRVEVSYLRGDAMGMPLPDASIDVVICAQVYEHVPDDTRLFPEIFRVLAPGGIVFFSGPNWLFPVEPHYFLPFLHWFPLKYAGAYLQLMGLGESYYERSRTIWGLRRLFANFEILDVTRPLLQTDFLIHSPGLRQQLLAMPEPAWQVLLPLLPNFNWVLRKPGVHSMNGQR